MKQMDRSIINGVGFVVPESKPWKVANSSLPYPQARDILRTVAALIEALNLTLEIAERRSPVGLTNYSVKEQNKALDNARALLDSPK